MSSFTAPRPLGTATLPTRAREDFPLTARNAAPYLPASRVSLRRGKQIPYHRVTITAEVRHLKLGLRPFAAPDTLAVRSLDFQDLSLIPKHSMPRVLTSRCGS